ncbi:hypothetical protein F0562_024087 [Nyssa sinensis]|uniref:Uncharacterized protein n=1 Tax=Nyssa sinensis TaxID=561372 RepID=A0A5J5BIF4_9ASTE|nr:hypothetical protein F0562_024087 [Nyssa sinensis]
MSNPYEKVKTGRLTFKGGVVASRSKTIDKKLKKKHKNKIISSEEAPEFLSEDAAAAGDGGEEGSAAGGGEMYTIDAAKRRKYEELFPVEAKKFGYDPKFNSRSVEDALDDRVKKKADRYCK